MSFTSDDYRRARHIVEDAAVFLQDAVRPSKRGRASLDMRILLTGIVLSLDLCSSATVTDVYKALTVHLPRELQWDLGVLSGDPENPTLLTIHQLYEVTKRITASLDYSPARAPHLAPEDADARQASLWEVTARLLAATHVDRPEGSADFALDGTAIWAHERAPRLPKAPVPEVEHEEDLPEEGLTEVETSKDREEVEPSESTPPTTTSAPTSESEVAADPDTEADGDHDDSDGKPRRGRGNKGPSDAACSAKTAKSGSRDWYYGYDVEALVRVPCVKSDASAVRQEPTLIQDLVVLPASTDIVKPCLDMLDRVMLRGAGAKALLVDRHYSYKRYRRWLSELLKRNIRQVADAHEKDQGFRDWNGMKIAASWVHCPQTPEHLAVIPSLSPPADDAERTAFEDLIRQRQAFAAQRVTGLNEKGESRWRCPARYGTVGCDLVDGSVAAAHKHLLPIVDSPPPEAGRPKICRQETVQITIETEPQARAMKLYQKEYWGTKKWRRDYNRRTYVEGSFGVLKSDTATGFSRGSIQFTGLPLVTIAVACAAAVTNVRLLRKWHEETGLGDETHPLLQPDQPFHGFTQLTEEAARALDLTIASEAEAAAEARPAA